MRGVPAWQKQRSGQHPSSVSALRADPPSPTRGEGRDARAEQFALQQTATGRAAPSPQPATCLVR
ncbi:MAG: hypothetical protein EOR04_14930 [Mesorhizobium sp.]|nr:MAG: hypothetical protein EOR04_14930 [Mesorhizobium sp.]